MRLPALFVAFAAAALIAGPALAQSSSERPAERSISVGAGPETTLAGTLVLPEGRPRAAVVMIQGTGPHKRDQTISGAPMFAEIAGALAEQGVASLRLDVAGVGESTGPRTEHFLQRVPHMTAAFDVLAARPELQGVPLGLFGHSEGTMVATLVYADRAEKIDFLVLLGAPGVPGRSFWIDQQSAADRFPDHDAAGLARVRAAFTAAADAAIAGDRAAVVASAHMLAREVGIAEDKVETELKDFIDRMASAEMKVLLGHDPAPAFGEVEVPVLAVWGAIDPLTRPQLNAPALLAAHAGKGELTSVIIPGDEHFFLRGEGLKPGEHKRGAMKLSPDLVRVLADWFADLKAE